MRDPPADPDPAAADRPGEPTYSLRPPAVGETGESGCWCCGRITAEEALVRLGKHPEVGLCINCVRFLGRRARDYQASVMRNRLRGAAESIRGEVMSRGWHERPVIGPALLWINRHVPW